MTPGPGGFGKDAETQGRGQAEIIQRGVVTLLRFLIPVHFEGATGDELAETVRAWFLVDTVENEAGQTEVYSEQRELVDWAYQVAADGTHHIWIFYAE